jgi:hypothetical protein
VVPRALRCLGTRELDGAVLVNDDIDGLAVAAHVDGRRASDRVLQRDACGDDFLRPRCAGIGVVVGLAVRADRDLGRTWHDDVSAVSVEERCRVLLERRWHALQILSGSSARKYTGHKSGDENRTHDEKISSGC